jgi:hypothetical protein
MSASALARAGIVGRVCLRDVFSMLSTSFIRIWLSFPACAGALPASSHFLDENFRFSTGISFPATALSCHERPLQGGLHFRRFD